VNNRSKSLLLVLLAGSVFGFGQQQPAPHLESMVAEAQQAQAAHDYAAAEKAYKQAIRIEPSMPELWSNLGLMQQQAGEIASAISSFQKANQLKPSLYVPNLFLGNDYLRTGKAQEAIPFLTKATKINKTDPQAPFALGRAYYAVGKFNPAAQEFTHAVALDPNLGDAWFALGIARLNQVELDARKISVEAKDSPFAGALFAESLEKQARFNEAATLYRSLLDSHPQPPCLHSALGIALLRHRDPDGAAVEFAAERAAHPECGLALLGEARIAIDRGDNQQALKLLQELWGRDHGFFAFNAAILTDGLANEDGISNRAASAFVAWFSQPETIIPEDFRNALVAAFNRNGQEPGIQNDKEVLREPVAPAADITASATSRTAEEYYAAGEFQRCAQRLDLAVAEGHADKLRLLAACSYFTGENDRAYSAAASLEALQPHSPEAMYWSIQANERLAVQALAHFQQLDSDSVRSHVLLGDIYHQLEREDDAQAEFQKALALEPRNPAAMLGSATAYLSDNNMDKAMETARTALERSPRDPELNMIVAETMVAKNQFAEAETYLLKSLTVKPQLLGHVHALMGKVYAETGRTKEAIEQLKLGESSDETGSIHYLLAQLYRQSGDTKDAVAALNQVKTIKQQRLDRGVKRVEDPDLSSVQSPPAETSTR
jgi:tetratricopeptide (TPR) repeat protein